MAGVYARKRKMVDEIVKLHLDRYHAAGDELILGEGKFVGPRTLQVTLRNGGERTLTAERVFVNVETQASIPAVPGMAESRPLTHHEALDLERVLEHLIVVGGGYVGLELGQALRRLGSRVTLIEKGSTTGVTRGSGCGGSYPAALPG
jgi:pyruvate/2-oxoglutarate dehydrogenase complex dihydrolipoamide dehydrogenase (E3) component